MSSPRNGCPAPFFRSPGSPQQFRPQPPAYKNSPPRFSSRSNVVSPRYSSQPHPRYQESILHNIDDSHKRPKKNRKKGDAFSSPRKNAFKSNEKSPKVDNFDQNTDKSNIENKSNRFGGK